MELAIDMEMTPVEMVEAFKEDISDLMKAGRSPAWDKAYNAAYKKLRAEGHDHRHAHKQAKTIAGKEENHPYVHPGEGDEHITTKKSEDEDVSLPEIRKALADTIKHQIDVFTKSLVELRERELAKAEGKMPKAGKVAHKAPGSGGQVLEKAGMGAAVPTAKPPSGKVPGAGAAPTAAVGSPGVGVAAKAPAGAPKPAAAGALPKLPGAGGPPKLPGVSAPAKPAGVGAPMVAKAEFGMNKSFMTPRYGLEHLTPEEMERFKNKTLTQEDFDAAVKRGRAQAAKEKESGSKEDNVKKCEHGQSLEKCGHGCGKKKVHKAEIPASDNGTEHKPGTMLTRGPEGGGPAAGELLTRGPSKGGPATGELLTRGPGTGGPATGKLLTRGAEGGGPATGNMFKGEKCPLCNCDEHSGKCAR